MRSVFFIALSLLILAVPPAAAAAPTAGSGAGTTVKKPTPGLKKPRRRQAPPKQVQSSPAIKLYPEINTADNIKQINSIPVGLLKSFMERPALISADTAKSAAVIIGNSSGSYFFTPGERIYAQGITRPGTYLIYHDGEVVTDADSGKILGQEIVYIGEAQTITPKYREKIIRRDGAAMKNLPADERYSPVKIFGVKAPNFMKIPTDIAQPLILTKVTAEIGKGDKLMYLAPNSAPFELNFSPHPAPPELTARVVRLYGSLQRQYGGKYSTIVLNKGTNAGLDTGAVLTLYQKIADTGWVDSKNSNKITFKHHAFPVNKIGAAMVYKVTADLAYAVVFAATNGYVEIGTIAAADGNRDLEDIPGDEQ